MRKNVRCPQCPRKFETAEEMLEHVRKSHKEKR